MGDEIRFRPDSTRQMLIEDAEKLEKVSKPQAAKVFKALANKDVFVIADLNNNGKLSVDELNYVAKLDFKKKILDTVWEESDKKIDPKKRIDVQKEIAKQDPEATSISSKDIEILKGVKDTKVRITRIFPNEPVFVREGERFRDDVNTISMNNILGLAEYFKNEANNKSSLNQYYPELDMAGNKRIESLARKLASPEIFTRVDFNCDGKLSRAEFHDSGLDEFGEGGFINRDSLNQVQMRPLPRADISGLIKNFFAENNTDKVTHEQLRTRFVVDNERERNMLDRLANYAMRVFGPLSEEKIKEIAALDGDENNLKPLDLVILDEKYTRPTDPYEIGKKLEPWKFEKSDR